jgi:hypothetical protein
MSSRLLNFVSRRSGAEIVARIRRALSTAAAPRHFDEAHPLVFCLSTGRAGTATLASLCALAPNVLAHHEPVPRLYRLSRLAWLSGDNPEAAAVLRAAFQAAREDSLAHALRCERGYVETSPQGTFLAPLIRQLFPEARFVHLVRHPRAVIRSALGRKWYAGNSADATRIEPRAGTAESDTWTRLSAFEKNLWLWSETNSWIERFMRTLPSGQAIRLRAEDLFAAETESCASLYNFLGSPLPTGRKIARTLSRKLNAQRSADVETQPWSDRMEAELAARADGLLKAFGYET